jgi:hypothetical protein
MFTFKNWKNVLQFVMWNDFPSFLTCIFYIFPFFTPGKQSYFEISEMTTHTPMNRASDIWWTLDFTSAFLSPGVNSRAELLPSPRAYARNGAPRRWLGDYTKVRFLMPEGMWLHFSQLLLVRTDKCIKYTLKISIMLENIYQAREHLLCRPENILC